MSSQNIYHYDELGVLSGTSKAEANPREKDAYLVPAFATTAPPPTTGKNQCARFRDGAWEVVADFRGTSYWLPDGTRHEVTSAGEVLPPDALAAAPLPPINEVKERACADIDYAAEKTRSQFLTPGSGQALTYNYKVEEAIGCVGDPAPKETAYPFLAASIGIDGSTVVEVAESVLSRRDQWRNIGVAIERIRLHGKARVREAPDHSAVEDVMQSLVWPEAGS